MKSEMEKLKEKQQRRRRRRTLRILAISPLIAVAFVLLLSLLTRVSTVLVRNDTPYSSGEIGSYLPFSVGDSLFSVDRDKLASELTVSFPYVKEATVEYGFPNRIEISLTPATVCFAVRFEAADASEDSAPTESGILLLDEDFKVLEKVEEVPSGVLFVDGMEISSYRPGTTLNEEENLQVSIIRDLISNLKRHNLYEHASHIDLSKKYNITMKVHDVIQVELGNSEYFYEKMSMLVKILAENDTTVPAQIRVRNYSEGRYSRLPDSSAVPSSEEYFPQTSDGGTPSDVENNENS